MSRGGSRTGLVSADSAASFFQDLFGFPRFPPISGISMISRISRISYDF